MDYIVVRAYTSVLKLEFLVNIMNLKEHIRKYWLLYISILGIMLLFLIGWLMNGSLISFNGWRFQK